MTTSCSGSLVVVHSVMSDSLRPHGLQHAKLPCPPSLSPRVCSTVSMWHLKKKMPHLSSVSPGDFSPQVLQGPQGERAGDARERQWRPGTNRTLIAFLSLEHWLASTFQWVGASGKKAVDLEQVRKLYGLRPPPACQIQWRSGLFSSSLDISI